MAKRSPVDHELLLKEIPIRFTDGTTAEGNNAAWACQCSSLLVGRCYFQFGAPAAPSAPGAGGRSASPAMTASGPSESWKRSTHNNAGW